MRLAGWIFIGLLFGSFTVFSQEDRSLMHSDTLRSDKNFQFVGVPFVFSTPETSFGFGAGAQLFFLNQSNLYNSRLSNMFVSAVYTLNKQLIIEVKPQIYFGEGDYFLDVAYKFQIFPNSFWGLGSFTPDSNRESYDMTSSKLRVAFMRRLPPSLNFGFEYISEYHNVTKVEEGGQLESGEIPGSESARIRGLGFLFNLDSRDLVESPTSGHFAQISAHFASKLLGSTQSYNKFIFDARTYQNLGEKSTLAMQVYFETSFGEIPFQTKATYGGGERARGYFRGRFIDDSQYVIQVEYRWRFKPRWIAAAYALVGEVAPLPRKFFKDPKPAAGAGIRWQIIKSQNTLVRLDVGFGENGSSGVYFGVNEAF